MEMFHPALQATKAHVMLASNSPRRRQLLQIIQPDFAIAQSKDVVETYPDDMDPVMVPQYLSQLKCQAYGEDLVPGEIIITADTVVINDGKILGKPHSTDEAIEMLKSLTDRTHLVVTGVTLMSTRQILTFAEKTEVTFGRLTDAEIAAYVKYFAPYDKAGAYGIQEWIGCVGISSINGCYYNVMGLPLHSLYQHLKSFQF